MALSDAKEAGNTCVHTKNEDGENIILEHLQDNIKCFSRGAHETSPGINPNIINWDKVRECTGLGDKIPFNKEFEGMLDPFVKQAHFRIAKLKVYSIPVYTSPLLEVLLGRAPSRVSNGLTNMLYLHALHLFFLKNCKYPPSIKKLLYENGQNFDKRDGPIGYNLDICSENRSNSYDSKILISQANFNLVINAINFFEENILMMMQCHDTVINGKNIQTHLKTPYMKPSGDTLDAQTVAEIFADAKKLYRLRNHIYMGCEFLEASQKTAKSVDDLLVAHSRFTRIEKLELKSNISVL
jgi:hypothetical protein